MNIHEYQAKELLSRHGVNVPAGLVTSDPAEAEVLAEELTRRSGTKAWVLKAQVHAGGRGKGGGIKLVKDISEIKEKARAMIGMQLVTHQTGPAGKKVNKILIQEDVYYPGKSVIQEFYAGILLNRGAGKLNLVYSPQGGMDIETVAENSPEMIFKEEIHPATGLQQFQARKAAFNLGLKGEAMVRMTLFMLDLYKTYVAADASLVEINPVVKTSDDRILAVDAKIVLDDNSLFRHPELKVLHDPAEDDPSELEASASNLNFVKLNGNVGCMVNGAGLAMATMDIIKLSGGEPANFLDVGGTANAKTVEAGFRIILKDPNVKAILINIFGGIVRCDRVAEGITDAFRSLEKITVPVIVRLQGTNAKEAKEIIDRSGLKVYSAVSLQDAADLVNKNVN
jgi:succinyl-CoA synthetase beta subunit